MKTNGKVQNMALIQCGGCGKQIDSTAAACPSCGRPKKSRLKWYILGVIALIVVISAAGGGKSTSAPTPVATTTSEPVAEPVAPPPKPIEIQVVQVQARELFADYEENEVSADNKYKGKRLLVFGTLHSVGKAVFSDSPILRISTSNQFLDIDAELIDSEADKAASLKKRQQVVLLCTGAGKAVTPQLNNCRFVSQSELKGG